MDFAALQPLEGGWSGRTFVATTAGERQVVRIFTPDETPALEVNAALHRLVRGLLPVPQVLDVRRGDPSADTPGLLVTSFVEGERGDVVLPELDEAGQRQLGRAMGGLVVALGSMPMLRAGRFVDADLHVEPFHDGDLVDFVAEHLEHLGHWSPDERAGLREVADDAQELLATVDRRVLVHSDLNPKNVLVEPDTLAITALVDWEFAHAGHPFTDLGNVLRFDRQPAYVEAVLETYAARFGTPSATALELARAADLYALVELASRRGRSPVTDRAERLLRGIARSRDAGWTPPLAQT